MPTFEEHVDFVKSKPYSKWYVIYYENERCGSTYLSKQDEIGIFIKNEFQEKGIGKKALLELMIKNPRPRYLANVSPKNKKSIKFFTNNGFRLLQHTYEIRKK